MVFLKLFKWLRVRAMRWHQSRKTRRWFYQILSHRNHQVTVYHWISNPVTEISSWPNLSFQWKCCNRWMKDGLERLEWEQKKNFQISTPSGCLFCFDYGTSRETGRWLRRKHSSTFLLNCGILDEHCATCVAQQWLCGRRFIFVDLEPVTTLLVWKSS